jgi:hypothetical protein
MRRDEEERARQETKQRTLERRIRIVHNLFPTYSESLFQALEARTDPWWTDDFSYAKDLWGLWRDVPSHITRALDSRYVEIFRIVARCVRDYLNGTDWQEDDQEADGLGPAHDRWPDDTQSNDDEEATDDKQAAG